MYNYMMRMTKLTKIVAKTYKTQVRNWKIESLL